MSTLERLQPSTLWKHFQTLCDIPRPSCEEEQLRTTIQQWATDQNLTTKLDKAGNLLIHKPATAGMEDHQTVVLQGHLDMVAQQNEGTGHNFSTDPIQTYIKDGWLHAKGTTLGADNGIGVAASLAVLESKEISHGPIEALFTIEEESSMRGALDLDEDLLQGTLLLNLDSEDRGEVYVGCAGGIDVNVKAQFNTMAIPNNYITQKVFIKGLRGGHSGVDIHKSRGNAIQLLVRLLLALNPNKDAPTFLLSSFDGGTLRNALPREASAVVVFPKDKLSDFQAIIHQLQTLFKEELLDTDPNVDIEYSESHAETILNWKDQHSLLCALNASPHGVERMSPVVDAVETSDNLGVATLHNGKFDACFLVRSLVSSGMDSLCDKIRCLFELIGATVTCEHGYPGWKPNPKSSLLTVFQHVHESLFSKPASVKVIHAGLECGVIGAKYPKLDMISFGPIIRGAHSPDERVHIESVDDFWTLLKEVLQAVPKAQ